MAQVCKGVKESQSCLSCAFPGSVFLCFLSFPFCISYVHQTINSSNETWAAKNNNRLLTKKKKKAAVRNKLQLII